MLTVQITLSGRVQRMTVDQVEFIQTCHYVKCRKEFTTIDPDKVFCRDSHRKSNHRLFADGPVSTATLNAVH